MNNKIENIKLLLEFNGANKSYESSILSIIDSISHLIPNFDKNKLNRDELNVIINEVNNKIIDIYDKYLTDDEVLGFIDFYKSSIGKSYLIKMSKIALETMSLTNNLGREIYEKLLKENNLK